MPPLALDGHKWLIYKRDAFMYQRLATYCLQHRLAAPQVGVLRRVVVIDVGDQGDGLLELINPVITMREGEQCGREGCLSLPGRQAVVTRPRKVTVQYQNRDGVHCEKTVEGLFARAVCHELDHLDGKLYIDVMDRELTPEEIEGHIPEDDNQ